MAFNFIALSALLFGLNVFVLAEMDLLPSPIIARSIVSVSPLTETVVVEMPQKIEIPSLNLSANISNPETADIAELDGWLLKGAVRYPTSARLGEDGNVVLFGHSSYLPVVGNRAYKAFNDIQKLKGGDKIIVYSSGIAYVYAVISVTKESLNDNKPISLAKTGRRLTLVTCNSFATKDDRFVVVADLVESNAIPL